MSITFSRLLPPRAIARRLKVPESWLVDEAKAGRLPHVDAGGVLLFDFDSVEQALVERARRQVLGGQQ